MKNLSIVQVVQGTTEDAPDLTEVRGTSVTILLRQEGTGHLQILLV